MFPIANLAFRALYTWHKVIARSEVQAGDNNKPRRRDSISHELYYQSCTPSAGIHQERKYGNLYWSSEIGERRELLNLSLGFFGSARCDFMTRVWKTLSESGLWAEPLYGQGTHGCTSITSMECGKAARGWLKCSVTPWRRGKTHERDEINAANEYSWIFIDLSRVSQTHLSANPTLR